MTFQSQATMASLSPTSVVTDPSPLWKKLDEQNSSQQNNQHDETRLTSSTCSDHQRPLKASLVDFIRSLPEAVRKRKELDIQPGAWNDPVANLFRYVRRTSVVGLLSMYISDT